MSPVGPGRSTAPLLRFGHEGGTNENGRLCKTGWKRNEPSLRQWPAWVKAVVKHGTESRVDRA